MPSKNFVNFDEVIKIFYDTSKYDEKLRNISSFQAL